MQWVGLQRVSHGWRCVLPLCIMSGAGRQVRASTPTASIMALPVCVIINASAHSDAAAHVELNRFFEAAGIQIEIKLTTSAKNVLEEVSAAILREPSMIIVGGGDGTLNAAAGLLIGSGIALGVLPLGTFNHFAKDLHVPLDVESAVATIAEGYCAQVDVGAVNDHFFLNNASLGIYPQLVETRHLQQQRLGRGKWPASVWAALAVLRRYPFVEVVIHDARRLSLAAIIDTRCKDSGLVRAHIWTAVSSAFMSQIVRDAWVSSDWHCGLCLAVLTRRGTSTRFARPISRSRRGARECTLRPTARFGSWKHRLDFAWCLGH